MTLATNQHHKRTITPAANGRYRVIPPQPAPITKEAKQVYGKLLLAVLGTAVLTVLLGIFWQPLTNLMQLLSNQEAVSAALKEYGLLGPLLLAVMQYLQVLIAVIPGHVFLIAAGYVYGFIPGLLLNWALTVSASQVAFLLARWAGRPFVHRVASAELVQKWETIAETRGTTFFTLSFMLPVFPTDMMNFVAGLTGISPRKFLVANMVGRLPGVVMLTLIGSHGLDLPNVVWAGLGLVAAALYIVGRHVMGKITQSPQVVNATATD